jgi:signal transduction histidine kinase
MQTVIETLLIAARSEARSTLGSAPAQEAAAFAIDALRPVGDRAGVRLRLASPTEGLLVGADRDIVAQALQPLLENALRHANTTVSVGVTRENSKVVFDVQDDGDGPRAVDANSLFEPGESTVGSAGLGLALARRLARSCGGEVTVDLSASGGRFILRLPAVAY